MDKPPYDVIAGELKSGKVIPFLGAGVCMVGRKKGEVWVEGQGKLPTGRELAAALAREVDYSGEPTRLDKVAQYALHTQKERKFRETLRKILGVSCQPNRLHVLLAKVGQICPLFVTTNYDTLLERAFRAEGVDPVCVFHAPGNEWGTDFFGLIDGSPRPRFVEDSVIARTNFGKRPVVFKMHGTLPENDGEDWDNYVITEDDYTAYLSQMPVPTAFFPNFVKSSFLFLGCSLEDADLRVLLHRVAKHKKDVPNWSIQLGVPREEKAFWEKRGVSVFDVNINEFESELAARVGGINAESVQGA